MRLYEEIDFCDVRDEWGADFFLEATRNQSRALLVRNAFDPAKSDAQIISPHNAPIRFTRRPSSFKIGKGYEHTTVRDYLKQIENDGEFYASWGLSSMNDKPSASRDQHAGARAFVDACLDEVWHGVFGIEAGDELPGHFIAGNTKTFSVKTPNHFVFTLNHVFQIDGEKTWCLCDPNDVLTMPEFSQFFPMGYTLEVPDADYEKLPFVETMVTRPGDYFFNAPMVGHAVSMGPGKNVMMSIRQPTRDVPLAPEWGPILQRTLNVVCEIILADAERYHRWDRLMRRHDAALYRGGPAVPQTFGRPGIKQSLKLLKSAVVRSVRRKFT